MVRLNACVGDEAGDVAHVLVDLLDGSVDAVGIGDVAFVCLESGVRFEAWRGEEGKEPWL